MATKCAEWDKRAGSPGQPVVTVEPLVENLLSRIHNLEHIFRQVEGTISVFIKHNKISFSTPQVRAIFDDLVEKWREEAAQPIGKRGVGRPRVGSPKSRLPLVTDSAIPEVQV